MANTKVVFRSFPVTKDGVDTGERITAKQERITENHYKIKKNIYCVRVTKPMATIKAVAFCAKLNTMARNRCGVMDRFQVAELQRPDGRLVIMRKALPGDLSENLNW